ncbi:zinc finger protein 282-like [Falco naumanni]|uniref:zinc finger protein 282-like n=1 Tax=Falco naumanni TaxID=148594 RepID=UPI001ADDEBAF|nr:zinc finger protein 282-like [Falco naumanni]
MSRRDPAQAPRPPTQKAPAMGPQAAAGQELRELRSRTERAERRLVACETLLGELGSSLAALGGLLPRCGQLQQRLDNVENLLKNRNFWILRLPPSSRGEVPKVPLTFDDISVYFNEQEWERLDRWQKDLYKAVMRGNYETLISLDYAVSKPDILCRIERDEELCVKDGHTSPQTHSGDGQEPPKTPEEMDQVEEASGEDEVPMEDDTDDAVSKPDVLCQIERDEELCVKDGQTSPQMRTGDSQKPPQTRTGAGQKSLQATIQDGQEKPQTCIGGGQKSPQTSIQDGQGKPQTHAGDSQEPPQTPEQMDQKEKALGQDKVSIKAHTELPILVMNIMSLNAQKEQLHSENQPETGMEEDPAESNTKKGFLTKNEMACEGDSSENAKVKEEKPEASSPSPEAQKCPKDEQTKAKSKKKPSKCTSSSLLMGSCRRGYVREWSHPCTECGKRFRLKINLIIHQRNHAKEGPYECTMCEISFADKRHLDLHQSIHIKDRAFGAKVWGNVHPELRIRPRGKFCGAFFGGTHSLGNGTGGPWLGQAKAELDRGSLSGACLPRQQSPKSHRKSVVKCNLCKKFFSCTFSLQRHLQTHSVDRPYCCATCKKCFTRRTHLSRHEKIHDRQRALAAPQQPTVAQPATVVLAPQQPQPQAAPKVSASGRVPRSPAQASEKNVSPAATAAKAVPASVLLVAPAELKLQDKNCHIPSLGGRPVRPVVRQGSRAAVSGVTEMTRGKI